MSVASSYLDEADAAPISEINVTPLVDIVLVVLIVFMIMMPKIAAEASNERELDVTLPKATQAIEPSSKMSEIVINIRASGEIVVHGEVLNHEQVKLTLQRANKITTGRTFALIRADRRVVWDHVLTVMDLCREAGIYDCRAASVGN